MSSYGPMLRRKSLEVQVFKGWVFNWDLETAWSKEYGFLGIGNNSYNLRQKQEEKPKHDELVDGIIFRQTLRIVELLFLEPTYERSRAVAVPLSKDGEELGP